MWLHRGNVMASHYLYTHRQQKSKRELKNKKKELDKREVDPSVPFGAPRRIGGRGPVPKWTSTTKNSCPYDAAIYKHE